MRGDFLKSSPSAQFSVRAVLSRMCVQLDARPVEEGYKMVVSGEKVVSGGKVVSGRKIVCSWKSSEFKSAEQREGNQKPRSQPDLLIHAILSRVCV